MHWNDVGQIISVGGTIIGTARCEAFRHREGRKAAARNLAMRGINSLIVIGGDGSLTGAEMFRKEWKHLIEEVQGNEQWSTKYPELFLVGLVGSIDNDMCGTEWTIGADTSLHRIVEAVDTISTSAMSHQRIFIIEVMGRHCGWLALMAAVACGADWVFIPEVPSHSSVWQEQMCSRISKNRQVGCRLTVIIISEGAIDSDGISITAASVQDVIKQKLCLEARITVLGHVQRGGSPSAYDRILATTQGLLAVEVLFSKHRSSTGRRENLDQLPRSSENSTALGLEYESVVIAVREQKICIADLAECVGRTYSVVEAYKSRDYPKIFQLRDSDFKSVYQMISQLNHSLKEKFVGELQFTSPNNGLNIAVICTGAPAGGMNAAIHAIVRSALLKGYTPVAIIGGFVSLEPLGINAPEDLSEEIYEKKIRDLVRPLAWMDVDGWISQGGCNISVRRSLPKNPALTWTVLRQFIKADALVIIGGYEGFVAARVLDTNRPEGVQDIFPILAIPATISNNVPGTENSLGADTALNIITQSCDIIRLSASSTKRLFCIEVQGGRCGYLAQFGALATGATYAYIPEEGISISDISRECNHLKARFVDDKKQGRLILVNEYASSVFNAEHIAKIIQAEGMPIFDARSCKLGHLQQGGAPSPRDRILSLRLGKLAMDYLDAFLLNPSRSFKMHDGRIMKATKSAVIMGIRNGEISFNPVHEVAEEADDIRRTSKSPWWLYLRPFTKILAKYNVEKDIVHRFKSLHTS